MIRTVASEGMNMENALERVAPRPATVGVFVYANLEDFEGVHEFSVTIAREGAELVVFSAGGEIQFQNENREAELLVPAFGVTFPRAGSYNLILKVGYSTFGSRRIIVNQLPVPQIGGA